MKKIKACLYLEENNVEIKDKQEWLIDQNKLIKKFNFRVYLIGRNPEKTQIPIIDSVISRIHAELVIKENKIMIKDLNSGIYLKIINSFIIYLFN